MTDSDNTYATLLGLKEHDRDRHGAGDLFSIEEFKYMIKSGSFIDDDGHGYWATETHYDSGTMADPHWIFPSWVVTGKIKRPHWATHVLWFNK